MRILKDILYNVALQSVQGTTDIRINSIQYDSRKVDKNDVFIAIKGMHSDGHLFIEKAIENGASVIVAEFLPENKIKNITYVEVESSSLALAFT